MSLPPLAWVPDDAVVVCGDYLHRPGCEQAGTVTAEVAGGDVLWCVSAPGLCASCRPEVELRLGTGLAA